MRDLQALKSVPILLVADGVGLAVRGGRASCWNREGHPRGDQDPSLSFNERTNLFRCFSCEHIRGSVIDLVSLKLGLSLRESIAWLAKRYGAGVTAQRQALPAGAGAADDIVIVLERLLELAQPLSNEAVGYLAARGLPTALEAPTRLGWLQDPEAALEVVQKEFGAAKVQAAGLLGKRGFLLKQHRLLFPFLSGGRVMYLRGRTLKPGHQPKELGLARPIPCLFGAQTLDSLQPGARLYVTEGTMDTLTLLAHGYAAVGFPGAHIFKPGWAEAIAPFQVVLVPHNDAAGLAGAARIVQMMTRLGKEVEWVRLPPGKDVNDLFLADPETTRKLLAELEPGALLDGGRP